MQKLKQLKLKLTSYRHTPMRVQASCGLYYEDFSPFKRKEKKNR